MKSYFQNISTGFVKINIENSNQYTLRRTEIGYCILKALLTIVE